MHNTDIAKYYHSGNLRVIILKCPHSTLLKSYRQESSVKGPVRSKASPSQSPGDRTASEQEAFRVVPLVDGAIET